MLKAFNLEYEVLLEDRMDDSGDLDFDALILRVSVEQHEQNRVRALFHEIIELVVKEMSIAVEHPDIMRLETGLYHVLSENGIDLEALLKLVDYSDDIEPVKGFHSEEK